MIGNDVVVDSALGKRGIKDTIGGIIILFLMVFLVTSFEFLADLFSGVIFL